MLRSNLQLTGCACLWIASKYHEIYAPEMRDFVYISDDAFKVADLIKYEALIVCTLEFYLTVPTALSFAQRFLKVLLGVRPSLEGSSTTGSSTGSSGGGSGGIDLSVEMRRPHQSNRGVQSLCWYILEHSLMHYEMCTTFKASQIAAASVCYACLCLRYERRWPLRLQRTSGYTVRQLKPLLRVFDAILKTPEERCKHKAVRKKYSHRRFGQVRIFFVALHCHSILLHVCVSLDIVKKYI